MVAGADISDESGYVGYIDTNEVKLGTNVTAQSMGIITDGGTADEDRVGLAIGHCKAKVGAAVAAGAMLGCNATGQLITAATTTAPYPVAIALEAAANANDVIEIFWHGQNIVSL